MSLSSLSKKTTLVVFAYSPAGLGHLRVTNALYEGLAESVDPVLLGSQDKTITVLHRFMSIHPITRFLFEWGQKGVMQYIMTFVYDYILHSKTKLLYQQILTILDERLIVPETLVVVATHFGLAHQLAHVKEKLRKDKNLRVLLFVQVTDDSPQPIWYIPGSDMTFVPSHFTKEELEKFQSLIHLPKVPMKVTPYPVAPSFAKRISPQDHEKRLHQVLLDNTSHIHIALPISGAAVGTEFIKSLIEELHVASDRFVFHVISKDVPYTKNFLTDMLNFPYVTLHVSMHDRETVANYEKVYDDYIISIEVTKPSEQTFKALLNPMQKGGSILLFANPVGRQEYDNIAFLRRHHLIPSMHVQQMLWEKAKTGHQLGKTVMDEEILKIAKTWRGLLLPNHSFESAQFISWCFTQGIFTQMMHYTPQTHSHDPQQDELGDNGVQLFWKTVGEMVEKPL